jgi:chromosome segregation protein
MRLKRLELFGFKSFADRTVLSFDRPLTGIVGPNGCGKSNVVDALRWALGETRPTSMRGGEMSDVIFKGSVSRPTMSVAEVTLVLSNEQGEIEARGAELSITRRVYASGEGEYLIDGEKVRLKDVRDMLFDTGLGSRGYAVLEQGRIDAVLSADPVARRAIFEEAAGISRYRQRRRETESRLKRVEQDSLRLDDVLRELATRVRSLKIQAGKAERFVAAREEWRGERGRYARHRLFAQRGELAALRARIEEIDARCAQLRALREGEEGDAGAREHEQRALSAEVDRQSSEVARLAAEVRACDERQSHLASRHEAESRAGRAEAERALQLAGGLERREADLETLRGDARTRGEERAALAAKLEVERRELESARAELAQLRAAHGAANAGVLALLQARTQAENSARHLEAARGPLGERRARLDSRLADLSGSARELAERARSVHAGLAEAESLLGEARERARELVQRLEEAGRSAREGERAQSELGLERARLESRVDALRDWERERESLELGARALLEAVEGGRGPCAPEHLRGLVADHLRTSTRLARALDGALGAGALALVVSDAGEAARAVAWLVESRAGLVRLTTPAGLGGGARPATGMPELAAELAAAIEGPLLEQVEVTPGFEELARWLVGDVLVVRDRAAALAIVAADSRWRCVTPEGELVDALGLVGGHREIAQGAVGRRASAAELESEIARVSARLAQAEQAASAARALEQQLGAELGHARAELEARGRGHAEAEAEGRAARARLADVESTLSLSERERGHLETELAALERDLQTARASLESTRARHAEESAALEGLGAQRAAAEARLAELQGAHGESQSALARVAAELDGLERRAADLERVLGEARRELERARGLAAEHAAAAERAQEQSAAVREAADRLLLERGEAERRLEHLRAGERAGREAIAVFRQRVDAVTRELELKSAEVGELRLAAQKVDLERGELAGRAREDLDLDEEALLADFAPEPELEVPEALDALAERVAEAKRRLDAIGPVNTEAVSELEEASGRFEFLDSQRKDLARAKQSLDEALARINEESLRLFTQTFEDVRREFQTLFRQLFGGGKADLELSTDGDPLEAGIEITARPPGREMLPIGLLSGGQRTMTALALLFAVFRARPSPFCVLDEVDAALDDANVGRFLGLLDTFLADSQFLVVTHNKGTMAACDALYGITMETKGVSNYVTVEFGQVDAIVPEATGDARAAASARAQQSAAAHRPEPEESESEGDEPVWVLEPAARGAAAETARNAPTPETAEAGS